MPSINFLLPHWAYWLALLVFPAIAMVASRRLGQAERPSLSLAYFLWLVAGYIGLHRLYLKNLWGLGYVLLFGALLYTSGQQEQARNVLSSADAAVVSAEKAIERSTRNVAKAEVDIPRLRERLASLEEGARLRRSTERRLKRAEGKLVQGKESLAEAQTRLASAKPALERAKENQAWQTNVGLTLLYMLVAAMLIDAALLPGFLFPAGKRRIEAAGDEDASGADEALSDERFASPRGFTGWVDRNSLWFGEFVAYWTVLAVMAFLYEVWARKILNSPTIWVQESVTYLFGMQYLIAGCYAMLTESHVRVDVFYAKFSDRTKAAVDLATSVLFFIFVTALLFWGWIFAMQAVGNGNTPFSAWARGDIGLLQLLADVSIMDFLSADKRNGEYSFNNPWEIPFWPVKLMIVLGALLLLLQGMSRVIKDFHMLRYGEPLHKVEG